MTKQFEEGESKKGLANTCEEQINSEGWELRIGLDNVKVTSTLVKNSTLEYLRPKHNLLSGFKREWETAKME